MNCELHVKYCHEWCIGIKLFEKRSLDFLRILVKCILLPGRLVSVAWRARRFTIPISKTQPLNNSYIPCRCKRKVKVVKQTTCGLESPCLQRGRPRHRVKVNVRRLRSWMSNDGPTKHTNQVWCVCMCRSKGRDRFPDIHTIGQAGRQIGGPKTMCCQPFILGMYLNMQSQ